MTTKEFTAGGKVVFWSLRESDRQKLKDGLTALEMAEYTPEPKTDFAALKDAIHEIYGTENTLVQALAKNVGFELIAVERGETANQYHRKGFFLVDSAKSGTCEPTFQASFDKHKNILCGSSITTCLTKIVNHLGGTLLRPQGGIYWIADRHAATWDEVSKVIEGAGISGSAVYSMNVKYDANMVRAVTAAIENEINAEAALMEADIRSGEIGNRALENRKTASLALREKVKTYEGLLGVTLPKLTESLEKVEALATVACMDLAALANPDAAVCV